LLTRIKISSFGRFVDTSFDLSKNTVFFGPNESGKTTIFDALALELCETSRREQKPISDIKKRYINGSENKAHIKIEPTNHPRLSPGLFFNFFAIRSSETSVRFDVEEGKDWVKKLRANLFFGGYDLTTVKNIFADLNKSRKSSSYPSRIHDIEEKIKELNKKIGAFQLSQYSSLYTDLQKVEEELRECEDKQKRIEENIKNLQKEQEKCDVDLQRLNFASWDKQYRQYETLLRQMNQFTGIDENEVQELEKAQENLFQMRENLLQRMEKLKQETENLRVLYQMMQGIDKEISHESLRITQRIRFFTILGVVFLVVGGIGLVVSVFSSAPLPFVIGSSVVMVTGLGSILLRFFFRKTEAMLHMDSRINTLYQQALQGKYIPTYPKSWESFCSTLEEAYQKAEQALREGENEWKMYEGEYQQFQRKLERFCTTNGVTNFKAAREILSKRKMIEREFNTVRDGLKNHPMLINPELSLEENHTLLIQRYGNLSSSSVSSLEEIERRKQEIKRSIEENEQKRKSLSKEKEELVQKEASLRSRLSQIEKDAQESVRFRQELSRLEEEESRLKKESAAVLLIEEILEEIDKESSQNFQSVAQEVQKEFGHIFPPFQSLTFDQLSAERMQLQDATHNLRPLNFLSKGTQDLFYLGMRLFLGREMWLVEKLGGTSGFFVFDEPFAALDDERVQIALAMLDEFQKKYDWQYIILTKDATLVDLIKKRWSDALVHTLSR